MTSEELERRRPVWEAMSDLFLDTEVRWSVPFVALRCAESGYDDETLEQIFWGEVFDEGIDNLTQVAGDWGMLTLNENVLIARFNKPSIPWLKRRALGWMVNDSWLGTREVTGWYRALPPAQRQALRKALEVLVRKYLEEEYPSALADEKHLHPVLDEARAWWPRFHEVLRRMRYDSDTADDVASARVEALLTSAARARASESP